MKKLCLPILATLLFTGCATQTYYVNGNGNSSPDREKSQAFFISGIGQEKEMNASEICGGSDKVHKVQSKLTFLDGLLSSITWGIYTPRTAKVYCTRK